MNSFKSVFSLLLVTILLGGCSAANIKPMQAQTSESASIIIVFRPSVLSAMLNDMIVAIDGEEVAVLQNKQFLSALVTPGSHIISVRGIAGFDSEVTVDTVSDQTVYFEAAGSANNVINFIPGTVLIKPNFYIEHASSFDSKGLTPVSIQYK